ncbi:MAG TPA: chemotaxis protein CheC [Anaerolineales bacterium]|nr:chemotaxis protein CheC [Anaerolineales bacterium]
MELETFDRRLSEQLLSVAQAGMHNAARGFSHMVNATLTVTDPVVTAVPLTSLQTILGGPENEAVGIYLRAEGELAGQFMMVVPLDKSLELVDLIMDLPPGTTQALGALERSALAELGNLTGSFFLNAAAAISGLAARPSPPAVVVDMLGAILDILMLTWDGVTESILMVQATFQQGERGISASFWVIPDRHTLEAVGRKR